MKCYINYTLGIDLDNRLADGYELKIVGACHVLNLNHFKLFIRPV